jgi:hypothetical protein
LAPVHGQNTAKSRHHRAPSWEQGHGPAVSRTTRCFAPGLNDPWEVGRFRHPRNDETGYF